MRVTVELQAYLGEYSPTGQTVFEYEVPDGANVMTLARALGVPDELASVTIVNDTNVYLDHPLRDGDRIIVIPPLAGG